MGCPRGRARTLSRVCDPSWAEGRPGLPAAPRGRGADGAGPMSGRADDGAPGGVANRVVLWCKGGCNEITTGNPGLTLAHFSRWLPGYSVPAHRSSLIRAAPHVRPGSGYAPGAPLRSQHRPGDRGGGRDPSRDPRHQEDSGQDPGRPETRHHCLPGLRHVPLIQRPGHCLLPSALQGRGSRPVSG